jgi:RNA methyltransferase, TrmH family
MSDSAFLISSAQNAKYKMWESLLTNKGRKKESLFILSGEKIIADFISEKSAARFPIKSILVPKNFSGDTLTSLKKKWSLDNSNLYFTIDSLLFKELDPSGTDFPLFICERPKDTTVQQLEKPNGLELALPLTDPANLGALCRTALSFNVSRIWLTPGATDPFHPKALRASSGGSLKLSFSYLSTNDFQLTADDFGLDLKGQTIYQFQWPKNVRLWLGEEGQGLKNTFLEKNKIYIPIKGMESLNATVAGSIAIFSYSQAFNKI